MTSRDEIHGWLMFAHTQLNKVSHVIVVKDHWRGDDLCPFYIFPYQDIRQAVEDIGGTERFKVIGVYNLAQDWDEQLSRDPYFAY